MSGMKDSLNELFGFNRPPPVTPGGINPTKEPPKVAKPIGQSDEEKQKAAAGVRGSFSQAATILGDLYRNRNKEQQP